jgi:outer membrane protein assembly factor BamB
MKRSISLGVLILALSVGDGRQAVSATEDYWPGWLGPERNGWVKDFKPPKTWPAELKKVWSVQVGAGYGTPLVAKGQVWQHARQGEEEVVWCMELATGKVKWSQRYPAPFKIGGGADRHGKGPKSCPVYADGRVFVMSITGTLSAWDAATGKFLWKSSIGKRFKSPHPHWGSSTSPIVDGDRVIAHFGNDDTGVLAAHDAKTGKVVWTQGKDGTCYSSPLLVTHQGIRQIIEWNHRVLAGIESKTGQLLWEYPFPHKTHNQNMPTPAFHDGQVLLGGENRGLHGFSPKLKDGKWTITRNWSQKEAALDMSSAVVNDGLLYGMSHYKSGQLFCLDPKNGKILWTSPPRTGNNVTFLCIPGHVIALINTGEVRVIKAQGKSYQPVASWKVADGGAWAAPVLLKDGLLIKDREHLTRWKF